MGSRDAGVCSGVGLHIPCRREALIGWPVRVPGLLGLAGLAPDVLAHVDQAAAIRLHLPIFQQLETAVALIGCVGALVDFLCDSLYQLVYGLFDAVRRERLLILRMQRPSRLQQEIGDLAELERRQDLLPVHQWPLRWRRPLPRRVNRALIQNHVWRGI